MGTETTNFLLFYLIMAIALTIIAVFGYLGTRENHSAGKGKHSK